MNITNVNVTTRKMLKKLGSAITIVGLNIGKDGSEAFAEWCNSLAKFKSDDVKCYITKGEVMNRLYGLTGDNAYQNDLNIVSFDLNDFEKPVAMTMPRFEIGARWLDDIISNNLAHESRKCA